MQNPRVRANAEWQKLVGTLPAAERGRKHGVFSFPAAQADFSGGTFRFMTGLSARSNAFDSFDDAESRYDAIKSDAGKSSVARGIRGLFQIGTPEGDTPPIRTIK